MSKTRRRTIDVILSQIRVRNCVIVTVDNSNDLKVIVDVERSLQDSWRTNAVQPQTIEEVDELGTRRGVLMKVKL